MEASITSNLKKKIASKQLEFDAGSLGFFEQLPIISYLKDYFDQNTKVARKRIFTPWITLLSFISQALDPDHSCRNAVKKTIYSLEPEQEISESTVAYCKARQRLSEGLVKDCMKEIAKKIRSQAEVSPDVFNRPVKLIDGSTIKLPDTQASQASYPQPSSQAEGVGFPMLRIVVAICLATGVVLDCAVAPYAGKETGEHALLREIFDIFEPGDIALGDAYYSSFFLIAQLQKRGVDVLFEQHASRKTDLSKAEIFSKKDHITTWEKPRRPSWMSKEEYETYPDTLTIREFESTSGGKILITTLLDKELYTQAKLTALYFMRWSVEVDLAAIKTTMNLEMLRCQTPEMARKELWVGLLAYNIIRASIFDAATKYERKPRTFSFKGCIQSINNLCASGRKYCKQLYENFLKSVSASLVGNRPNRKEPRVVKRRPKTHPLMTKPRAAYAKE